jgi:hypothetical protein
MPSIFNTISDVFIDAVENHGGNKDIVKKLDEIISNQTLAQKGQDSIQTQLESISAFLGMSGTGSAITPEDQKALDDLQAQTKAALDEANAISTKPPGS